MRNYAKYVVSFGLCFPQIAGAVGLGTLKVDSTLNRPLKAYIRLTIGDGTPLDGIKVKLASPEAFQRAGINRPYFLSKLQFQVMRLNGRPVIKISSLERVEQPYMNVLLDVTWAKGQFYRAYTILLDPPGYEIELKESLPTQKAIVPKIYRSKLSQSATTPIKTSVVDAPKVKAENINKAVDVNTQVAAMFGPTKDKDDLWQIALKYKPQNASIDQVMIAIVQLNPGAFTQDNINGLKLGTTLKIPSYQAIMSVSKADAAKEVEAHKKAWTDKTPIVHVIEPASIQPQLSSESKVQQDNVKPESLDLEKTAVIENADSAAKLSQSTEDASQVKSALQAAQETNQQQTSSTQSTFAEQQQPMKSIQQLPPKKQKLFDAYMPVPTLLKQVIKEPTVDPQKADQPLANNALDKQKIVITPEGTAPSQSQTTNEAPLTLDSERMKTAKAEANPTMSGIKSLENNNRILKQQVQALTKKSDLLEKKLELSIQKDQDVHEKIRLLMKVIEADYQVTPDGQLIKRDSIKQSSEANADSLSLMDIISLVVMILAVTTTAGFAWLYFRQQQSMRLTELQDDDIDDDLDEDAALASMTNGSAVEEQVEKRGSSDAAIISEPATEVVIDGNEEELNSSDEQQNEIEDSQAEVTASDAQTSDEVVMEPTDEAPPEDEDELVVTEISEQPDNSGDIDDLVAELSQPTISVTSEVEGNVEEAKPEKKIEKGGVKLSSSKSGNRVDVADDTAKKSSAMLQSILQTSELPSAESKVPAQESKSNVTVSISKPTVEVSESADLKQPATEEKESEGLECELNNISLDSLTSDESSVENASEKEVSKDDNSIDFVLDDLPIAKKEDKEQPVDDGHEDSDDNSIDFDLSGISLETTSEEESTDAAKPAEAAVEANEDNDYSLDFELSTDEPAEPKQPTDAEPKDSASMDAAIDKANKESIFEPVASEPEEEVAFTKGVNMSTQLALAETYIAMEDWESAKTSLEEVIQGGTPEQKVKAEQLLTTLPK